VISRIALGVSQIIKFDEDEKSLIFMRKKPSIKG